MIFTQLTKNNIQEFKDRIDIFFFKNLEAWKFFHPHNPDWNVLKQLINDAKLDFYGIAVDENNICGYGMLRGWDEGYEIPSLGIVIDKDYQGKGCGLFIMNELHAAAKSHGAKKIRLTVYKENNKAISLYNKLGYVFSNKNENELIGIREL